MPRRLVAIGDTIYVTLGIDAAVTAVDAADGKALRTYAGTAGTEEIVVRDGVLFLVVNPNPVKRYQGAKLVLSLSFSDGKATDASGLENNGEVVGYLAGE